VVTFGGGTGLPVLFRDLRDRVGDLTAVVTVADDGGSSGRLRQELGVAPPGDVRNCLVALASRRRLAEVFNYRFEGEGELSDHTVGNIIIAALSDMAGGFCEGVEQAARFLRIKGRVYPAATESLTLVVHYADGTVIQGESVVREVGKAVSRIEVEPPDAAATPGVRAGSGEKRFGVLGELGGRVVGAPSILSADFAHLADEVRWAQDGGAELVHFDAMDNHFVSNLTIGPAVATSLAKAVELPIDAHLMVDNPDNLIKPFTEAGVVSISIQPEAVTYLHRTLTKIREGGCEAGIALNPTGVRRVGVALRRLRAGDEREPRLRRPEVYPRDGREGP